MNPFLFVGTHFRIFVQTVLIHLRDGVRISSKARPLAGPRHIMWLMKRLMKRSNKLQCSKVIWIANPDAVSIFLFVLMRILVKRKMSIFNLPETPK